MPTYDFRCPDGHLIEARRGYEVAEITCPLCLQTAERQAVYLSQSLVTETGVRSGRRNPIPRDEKRYDLSLFREATAEREHAYHQVEREIGHELPAPNLWKAGKQQADAVRAGAAPPPKGTA